MEKIAMFFISQFSKEKILRWLVPAIFSIIGAAAGVSAQKAQEISCSEPVKAIGPVEADASKNSSN